MQCEDKVTQTTLGAFAIPVDSWGIRERQKPEKAGATLAGKGPVPGDTSQDYSLLRSPRHWGSAAATELGTEGQRVTIGDTGSPTPTKGRESDPQPTNLPTMASMFSHFFISFH